MITIRIIVNDTRPLDGSTPLPAALDQFTTQDEDLGIIVINLPVGLRFGRFDPGQIVAGQTSSLLVSQLAVISQAAHAAGSVMRIQPPPLPNGTQGPERTVLEFGPPGDIYADGVVPEGLQPPVPVGHQLIFDTQADGANPGPHVIQLSLIPASLEREVTQRQTGGGGGGGSTVLLSTFVYRPGGVPSGNVYTSWAAMVAAMALVPGPKWVEVDDSIVSPAIIPTGTFNMQGATIRGREGQQITQLQGSADTVLTNCFRLEQNLQLQHNDPDDPMIILNPGEFFDLSDGASMGSLTAQPVLAVTAAGAGVLRLQQAALVALGGPAAAARNAGAVLDVLIYEGSTVVADMLEGDVGTFVNFRLRDAGADVNRTQSGVLGTLNFDNIPVTGNEQPTLDNLFDAGQTTSRWRSTVSRVSLAVALVGVGAVSAPFGANSVGEIAGVANAVDAAATATVELGAAASPELSPTSARGVATAAIAGSLAHILASGPAAEAQGLALASSANGARIQSTGYASLARGYANAAGYDATILASGKGAFASGYSQSYSGAPGYGATTLQATERGSAAIGAASYFGEVTANGWGSMARGVGTGGGFVQSSPGRIIATGIGSFASGLAEGGDVEALLAGGHAMGRARFATAGHKGRLRALERGCWAGGSAFSGEILAGSVAGYGDGSLAFGNAITTIVGGTIARIAAGQFGAVAMGQASGPNALIQAYNVASLAFGTAFSNAATATAELVTSGDQAGSIAMGVAEATGALTGRVRSADNASFALGRASAAAANAYLTASKEGAFAMGDAVNGSIVASQQGAMAMGKTATGSITASALGSEAHGNVSGGRAILASGNGSLARGNASAAIGGADITASGIGSFAQGSANTGAIVASAENSVQFGPGTNSVADSMRIGSAGLHFKGTAGPFGAAANGQFWVYNTNVYCQTGGVTKSLTAI